MHSLIKPRRPHAEAYTAAYIHIVIHIIYKDINDRSGLPRVNQRGGQGDIEMERDRLYIETRTVRRIIIDKNVLYVKKEEIDVNARVSRLGGQNEGIKIIRRRIARDTVVNRLSRFLSGDPSYARTAHDLLAHKLSFVCAL